MMKHLKLNEKERGIFKEINRIRDESNRINQILNSEDCRIDLLKENIRRRKKKININTLPNLIYNQGNNNIPIKISNFKSKEKKKITGKLSKTVYPNSKREERKKTPFNKYQNKTFFDNNNCTYDYEHHLKRKKKLEELLQLSSIIGTKKE